MTQLVSLILEKANIEAKEDWSQLNFASIFSYSKEAGRYAAEILSCPYFSDLDEFEATHVVNMIKAEAESEDQYQRRLVNMSNDRLVIAQNKTTEEKFIFCTDPTAPALDDFLNYRLGILEEHLYLSIILESGKDYALSYSEDESMPSFVHQLMRFAHDKKATDINITTTHASCIITIKQSGEWSKPTGSIPLKDKNTLIRALCAMSTSKPSYKSGSEMKFKISTSIGGLDLGFRVGIMPTGFGENISLRKLPSIGNVPNLKSLGLFDIPLSLIQKDIDFIQRPKHGGLILVTGETGSGKTTLLAAMIQEFSQLRKKVSASEDPIEILQTGAYINQTQVGELEGLSHYDALIGFLRQNPDVIVVGEIRDSKTLMTAIDGALRGHYVLSTLHTASVEKTFAVIKSMGIDVALFEAAIKAVYSVTLISKLCIKCRIEISAEKFERNHTGCASCSSSGLSGVAPAGEFCRFAGIPDSKKSDITSVIRDRPKNYFSMVENVKMLVHKGIIDHRYLESEEFEDLSRESAAGEPV